MKITICLLLIIAYAVALPADVSLHTTEEVDISKLIPNNIYREPVNPIKIDPSDLPGSRIIGGTEVPANAIPYQVAVIINDATFCGGSLISASRVLTAAHCTISASFVEVRLGVHRINQNEDTQVRITSTNVINHALYDVGAFAANDIAVILLPSAVNLNAHIQTVALAPANAGSYEGSSGLLTGWGKTSDWINSISTVLRAVNLNIISNSLCRDIFGDTVIIDSTLCTSGFGIVGACNGDSGGPLVVNGLQVGVVSFGGTLCQDGDPTAYARVSSFRSWIQENAGV